MIALRRSDPAGLVGQAVTGRSASAWCGDGCAALGARACTMIASGSAGTCSARASAGISADGTTPIGDGSAWVSIVGGQAPADPSVSSSPSRSVTASLDAAVLTNMSKGIETDSPSAIGSAGALPALITATGARADIISNGITKTSACGQKMPDARYRFLYPEPSESAK